MSNVPKRQEDQNTLVEQQAREAVARYNAARVGKSVESVLPADDTEEHGQTRVEAKKAVQKWLQLSRKLVGHALQNTEETVVSNQQMPTRSTVTGFAKPVEDKSAVTPQVPAPKSTTPVVAQTTVTPQREKENHQTRQMSTAGLQYAMLSGRPMLSAKPTTADIRALVVRMRSDGRSSPI